MSEAGWKASVTAEGVADWVVLHGGPTAAFRTASIRAAAQLAAAIAEVPGLEEASADRALVQEAQLASLPSPKRSMCRSGGQSSDTES